MLSLSGSSSCRVVAFAGGSRACGLKKRSSGAATPGRELRPICKRIRVPASNLEKKAGDRAGAQPLRGGVGGEPPPFANVLVFMLLNLGLSLSSNSSSNARY